MKTGSDDGVAGAAGALAGSELLFPSLDVAFSAALLLMGSVEGKLDEDEPTFA